MHDFYFYESTDSDQQIRTNMVQFSDALRKQKIPENGVRWTIDMWVEDGKPVQTCNARHINLGHVLAQRAFEG